MQLPKELLWVALVSAVSVLVYYLSLLNAGLGRTSTAFPRIRTMGLRTTPGGCARI
jgi:hypothetical protein